MTRAKQQQRIRTHKRAVMSPLYGAVQQVKIPVDLELLDAREDVIQRPRSIPRMVTRSYRISSISNAARIVSISTVALSFLAGYRARSARRRNVVPQARSRCDSILGR